MKLSDSMWETFLEENDIVATNYLSRMRIHGGWLVRSENFQVNDISGEFLANQSICFVPDPNYAWQLP